MASNVERKLFDAVTKTATATSDVFELDNGDVDPMVFLSAAENSGTATLDLKLQHSPDNSTWFDVVSMTQLSASGSEHKPVLSATIPSLFRYVRAVATITGTGNWTFSFWLLTSWATEARVGK